MLVLFPYLDYEEKKKKDDWWPIPSLPLASTKLPGSMGCQSVWRHGRWWRDQTVFRVLRLRGQRPVLQVGGRPSRVNPVLQMLMLTRHPEGKGRPRREAEP